MSVARLSSVFERVAHSLAPRYAPTELQRSQVRSVEPSAGQNNRFTISSAAWLATVIITAASAIVLMAYALPAESDWTRILRQGNTNHDLGWIRYTFGFTYFRWQGRWASCGLESLILPYIDPVRAYPLLIAGIAAVDVLGLYVVSRWFARGGSRGLAAAMTIGAAALLWAGLPSVAEGVYWSLGAIENVMVLSLAAMLLVGVAALRSANMAKKASHAAELSLCVGIVVVCGFHELYGSMLWLALGAGCAAAVVSKTGTARLRAMAWSAASVGVAIVVLAPGNSHRLEIDANPHSRQFLYDLHLAASLLWRYGREWVFDPKLLAAALWVAFSLRLESARVAWPSAKRFSWRWTVPALAAAMVSLGFFLPCYAFGNAIPGRTLSGVYIVFVAGTLFTVFAWTRRLEDAPTREPVTPQRNHADGAVVRGAQLLFAAGLLSTGNVPTAMRDMLVRVRPWHAASEQRYARVRQATHTNSRLTVPSLPPQPWSLLAGEISDNPHDWHNTAVADFYHLRSVAREPVGGATAQASLSTSAEGQ